MPAQNGGSVEQRILEMRLDHQKFESGAKRTIGILEKLDAALGSLGKNNSDGFDAVGDSLDKVTNKISIMGTVGDQIIRNLTTKAMELVGQMMRLTNELTIDQIGAGWSKYAEKTQGIQTIMAATAKDWEDQEAQMEWVNAQIEKLNWFTDETSYNFLDMVNNIGKFTSAGVELTTAVTAMEGIATWAALSGANAQTASHAMYQLSQAMGSGAVRTQDWRSIETANMATKEFKETVLATAADLKTLINLGNGKYRTLATSKKGETHEFTAENFREYLKDDWFTTEVLIQALQQYGDFADALQSATIESDLTASEFLKLMDVYESGDMKEFNRLAGKAAISVAELTELIEKLSGAEYDLGRRAFRAAQEAKTFQEAIDSVKDAASTSWMNLFEKMFGGYLDAKEVWTDMSESLYTIFVDPINKLNKIFKVAFAEEGPALTTGQNLFTSGLLNLLRIVENISEALSDAFDAFFGGTAERGEQLYYLIERFHRFTESIQFTEDGLKALTDRFTKIFGVFRKINQLISSVVSPVIKVVRGILSFISDLYERLSTMTLVLRNFRTAFTNILDGIKSPFTFVSEHIKNLIGSGDKLNSIFNKQTWIDRIAKLFTILSFYIRDTTKRFKEFMAGEGVQSWIFDRVNDLIFLFNKVKDVFTDVFNKIVSLIDKAKIAYEAGGWTGVFDLIGNSITDFLTKHPVLLEAFMAIKNFGESIKNIFEGIIAPIKAVIDYASMSSLSNILGFSQAEDMPIFFRILDWLYEISIKFRDFTQRFKEFMSNSETISFVIEKFDLLRSIVGSVIDYILNFKENGGFTGVFERISALIQGFLEQHPVLLNIIEIIKTIALTIRDVVTKGASILGSFINFIGDMFKNENGMFEFSIVKFFDVILKLIQKAFEFFFGVLGKLLSGKNVAYKIRLILRRVAAFLVSVELFRILKSIRFVIENFEDIFSSIEVRYGYYAQIVRMILMVCGSLLLIAISLKILSTISWDGLAVGLVGLFGIVALILYFLDTAENVTIKGGLSLISMALTVVLLASTIKRLGKLQPEEIIQGLGAVAIIIRLLMFFMEKADTAKGIGGWNLIAMALTVVLLGATLKSIAKLKWYQIILGFAGLAAVVSLMMLFMKKAESVKGKGLWNLIAMALSVSVLSMSLKSIAKLKWYQIILGFAGLAAVVSLMMLFMKKAESVKGKGLWNLIAMALSVAVLSMSLKSIAELKWYQILFGFLGLAAIVNVMMAFMKHAESAKGKGTFGLILMTISVVALANSLKQLAQYEWYQLLAGFLAIAAIINAMMAFLKYAENSKAKAKDMLVLLEMAGIIVLIGTVLALMATQPWENLLAAGIAMSLCLIAISGAMAVTSKYGKSLKLGQIISLLVGVGLMVAIGFALSLLANKFDWNAIGKAALVCLGTLTVLALLMAGLGQIPISSIGKGLLSLAIISAGAMLLFWGLAALGQVIASSTGYLTGVDWNAFGNAAIICLTIITYVALLVAVLGAIPIVAIAKGLLVLTIVVAGVALLVWGLAALGNVILDSLIDFALKLNIFAVSLKPFIDTISTFDESTTESFKRFADIMLSIMIAEFWGMLASWMAKLADTKGLAESLTSFIVGLQPFIALVGTVTHDTVQSAIYLGDLMWAVVGAEFWSVIASVMNALTSDTIGTRLAKFMEDLRPFLENIPVVTDEDVAHAGNISALMKAAFKSEFWSALGNLFSGNNEKYAAKLSEFAKALIPFIEAIGSIDETMLSGMQSTMDLLYDFNKKDIISDFGSQLNSFYKNFNGKNIKGDLSGLRESIELIREFISTITVYDSTVNVSNTADNGIDAFVGQVASRVGDISDSGLTIDTSLIEGMLEGQPLVDDSGSDLADIGVDSIVDQLNIREDDINLAGFNVGAGLADGMLDSSSLVNAAGAMLGNEALSGFTDALDIRSPSRVMAAFAAFIPAGVAKGITDNMSDVDDSMTILGSAVLAAMQMAMANVAAVADDSFEFNPTITPVVDLSNVSAAAGTAGSIFGGATAAMRASVRIAADNANSTMAALQYNDGSNNIVNELEFLSDKVDKLGDAITNMKIVLDTGLLVGATSGKMNTALGVAQMRSERGN